jgi:chemotaxis protein methyltransferase WspC
MSLAEVACRLRESIGLDPTVIGADVIHHAVRERMAGLGLSVLEDYAVLLRESDREMQELAEGVVVPETWFFRDQEPFAFLAHYASSEWLPARRPEVLRVISVPCSTGEEPYSIAMTLLGAGLTPSQFHIDAVDVSQRALKVAREAVYGKNSFRGENLGFRDRYFESKGDSFCLRDAVSRTVTFMHGNLLDRLFLSTAEPYHVVFCRNLLIYLAREARARILGALNRLLARPGLLFVGHAETLQVASEHLVEVKHPRAFAFRTREVAAPQAPAVIPKSSVTGYVFTNLASPENPGKTAISAADRLGKVAESSASQRISLLESAIREADKGNLASAAGLCEKYLSEHGPSAQAYFILGLVQEASGQNSEAEEFFNKAVYLDPAYYEALIHLALLTRQRDPGAAELLEQRARRAKPLNGELSHG